MSTNKGTDIDDAIAIAEDGDTILIIGPEKLHLRIYACILMTTSPVFRAMFDPKWRQGQTKKSAAKPIVQTLEDDNATAMHYLCALLHFRNEMVPMHPLTGDGFLDIAVSADKYDMGKALVQIRDFRTYAVEEGAGGMMMIAAAAYLLRNAKDFRWLTKWLVLNYSGPYGRIFNDKTESIMDWRVTWWLHEQREIARNNIKKILSDGHRDMPECPRCWRESFGANIQGCLDVFLERKDFLPPRSTCISESIKRGKLMLDLTPPGLCEDCRQVRVAFIARQKEDRARELKSLKKKLGLCLDCVLSGEVDLSHRCDHSQQVLVN